MTYTGDLRQKQMEISILSTCVYVDDLLVASHRAQEIMDEFGNIYRLKEEAKEHDIYLGASICKRTQENGSYYWEMNSEKNIR